MPRRFITMPAPPVTNPQDQANIVADLKTTGSK